MPTKPYPTALYTNINQVLLARAFYTIANQALSKSALYQRQPDLTLLADLDVFSIISMLRLSKKERTRRDI